MSARCDLVFLDFMLCVIIEHKGSTPEETDAWLEATIEHHETKTFMLKRAKEISEEINPILISSVKDGYRKLKTKYPLRIAINILEKSLSEEIMRVTGETKEQLYKQLKRDIGIAKLYARGIHIDENGNIEGNNK